MLSNPAATAVSARHGALPAQVALAWLLGIAPNVLLIAGTTSRGHLAENLAATDLALSDDEIASLTNAFSWPPERNTSW
jgi:pyridoxine 4-dehydrogenase